MQSRDEDIKHLENRARNGNGVATSPVSTVLPQSHDDDDDDDARAAATTATPSTPARRAEVGSSQAGSGQPRSRTSSSKTTSSRKTPKAEGAANHCRGAPALAAGSTVRHKGDPDTPYVTTLASAGGLVVIVKKNDPSVGLPVKFSSIYEVAQESSSLSPATSSSNSSNKKLMQEYTDAMLEFALPCADDDAIDMLAVFERWFQHHEPEGGDDASLNVLRTLVTSCYGETSSQRGRRVKRPRKANPEARRLIKKTFLEYLNKQRVAISSSSSSSSSSSQSSSQNNASSSSSSTKSTPTLAVHRDATTAKKRLRFGNDSAASSPPSARSEDEEEEEEESNVPFEADWDGHEESDDREEEDESSSSSDDEEEEPPEDENAPHLASPPPDAPKEVRLTYDLLRVSGVLKRCRFNVSSALINLHREMTRPPGGRRGHNIAGGRTQCRKTMFKFAGCLLASVVGVTSFVTTSKMIDRDALARTFQLELCRVLTAMETSRELDPWRSSRDFTNLMDRLRMMEHFVQTMTHSGLDDSSRAELSRRLQLAVEKSGILVGLHNSSQIKKFSDVLAMHNGKLVPGVARPRVCLFLDEADEVNSTADGSTKKERALEELLSRPGEVCLIVHVTATILPVLIALYHKEEDQEGDDADGPNLVQGLDFTLFTEHRNYIAIESLRPFRDPVTNVPVYLEEGELTPSSHFVSPKVFKLVESAVVRPNSLVCIITNPRVTASGHVFAMTNSFLMNRLDTLGFGDRVGAMVVTGSEIRVQLPRGELDVPEVEDEENDCRLVRVGDGDWMTPHYISTGKRIVRDPKRVLETMDKFDAFVNRRGCILVAGCSQMMRGTSFRTNTRVPTHIVHFLSKSHSVEKVVQSLGRATGELRRELARGGFEGVTALGCQRDLETAAMYPKVAMDVEQALTSGRVDTLREALKEAIRMNKMFLVGAGKRSIGNKRQGCNDLVGELTEEIRGEEEGEEEE